MILINNEDSKFKMMNGREGGMKMLVINSKLR